ncbi:MAG: type II secretion system minor pseudopilin GspI [gamma proteobacterium symbiont of Bathyaustriella thionipta]|nr:type II secretion system minor pseudopilin GspI [gamma proteobacterium symbiont of Bathyaustriella thionipta]MCU7951722.1 type II secretion system minor pseudopilin GspI [gamma proteobacterium symbiont of Bathyaustriella thionipta]MCU7952339.1 type II secretion system minor pseudopilin GspI [gamma proteobacterium symbiont of Bathyaustriella thionipta]MCU7958321.1 type II secretion system minor pseudopilin GspI [gamma proteobacterium symbiont of Bathyaustriella thionipta]MCU7965776.1 type II 
MKPYHLIAGNKQQGFTLIEIIIALVVIAVALGAVIATTGNSFKHAAHIKDKTLALWVAQNTIAEMTIANQWPANGTQSDNAMMAGKQWYIKRAIKVTPDSNIRRMDLSVYSDEKTQDKVVSLTTYLMKPQALKTP